MSREPQAAPGGGKIEGDRACYPGTDVLVNKFGISDPEAARAVEYKFAAARSLELEVSPIQGDYDLAHLQAIHKHVFQDVYDWAGQVRKVDFAKRSQRTGLVSKFIPEAVLDIKAEQLQEFVKDNNYLRDLPKQEFVKAFTEVHTRLNELHPFREGNGRATRVFLQQLAQQAGYELNMVGVDRDQWNHASSKAMTQVHPRDPGVRISPDKAPMLEIFDKALQPTREHAFKHEPREEVIRLYPDLAPTYARLDAIEKHVTSMPNPGAGARVIEAEKGRIGARLHASSEEARKAGALGKLQDEKAKLGGGRTSAPDGYEVVANVLADVLKQKGLSPAAFDKTMADANQRLNRMREAGVPAPGFAEVVKSQTPQPQPEQMSRVPQPGQQKRAPDLER